MKNDVFGGMRQVNVLRADPSFLRARDASTGLIRAIVGLRRPFWTCHSSGNQVDGLPLALSNKDAVTASCRRRGRAARRILGRKNLMIDETYQGKLLVNLCFSDLEYQKAPSGCSE